VTHMWESASYAFQRVHFDFAGPFRNKHFGIIVDAYSKFPIVKILNDITSHRTIKFCRESIATFGIPEVFVSNNGTQLCSKEFSDFLKSNGIKHKQTAPFNPATNGQAERFVQILKNALISLHSTSHDLELNLQKLLIHYRITQHYSTNISPSELVVKKRCVLD
jgi:transposase InsO family protein